MRYLLQFSEKMLLAVFLCSYAAASDGWTRKADYFCHPGVRDSRLHTNTSATECQSLCEQDERVRLCGSIYVREVLRCNGKGALLTTPGHTICIRGEAL